MDHYLTIVANGKLRSFPLMTSAVRCQGHSGLPPQPLQSLEKFLLLLLLGKRVQNRGLEARYGHGPLLNYCSQWQIKVIPFNDLWPPRSRSLRVATSTAAVLWEISSLVNRHLLYLSIYQYFQCGPTRWFYPLVPRSSNPCSAPLIPHQPCSWGASGKGTSTTS